MAKAEKDQYFKIRKERRDYLGERYFKFNYNSEKVVQVCLNPGDVKKGKSNTFGVYIIHRMTLASNYLAPNYIEACSKKEYEKQFKKAIKLLE